MNENADDREYIALAENEEDVIVFFVKARNTSGAWYAVKSYYEKMEWKPARRITTRIKQRSNANPQQVANIFSQRLLDQEAQIKQLCRELLNVADGEEAISERDRIYEFVSQFEAGRRLIGGEVQE